MNPLKAFLQTFRYFLSGQLHFPKDRLGKTIPLNGHHWTIFREIVLEPTPPEKPGAIFKARFRPARMNPRVNIWFSILPIPFFVGLPGFRSKIWLFCEETGDFQGIYEWDTVEDARNYQNSYAGKFMAKRSIPGSVSFEILDSASSTVAG